MMPDLSVNDLNKQGKAILRLLEDENLDRVWGLVFDEPLIRDWMTTVLAGRMSRRAFDVWLWARDEYDANPLGYLWRD